MLPRSLECTECGEKIWFPTADRAYYTGCLNKPEVVNETEYLQMLVDPIWCIECNKPSWGEVIPTLNQLEDSFGLVKSGKMIEFPFNNKFMSQEDSLAGLRLYQNWAQIRQSKGRCVICSKNNFAVLGGAPVKLKHEPCDYGVFKPRYYISSYNAPMQTLVYNVEGFEIGKLSYWNEDLKGWTYTEVDKNA